MTTKTSGTKRRRLAAVVASAAFVAAGTGWAGCGDEDEVQDAADQIEKQADELKDEADKALEDAQQQLEDAGY